MRCCRCGANAVVTRDQQYYCGRCALARDWEEIIAIAQDAAVGPLPPAAGGRPDGGRVAAPV
jgi:hypothetical protein